MAFRATYAAADRAPADGRLWYGLDRGIPHQEGRAAADEMFADLSAADLGALLVAALEWWQMPAGPRR